MLRGEVIDLFAQIERAVSTVLVHAAALPEYKALKPALPHLMGQKLERLRKLMSEAGPLKSRINGVAPLVEKLTSFEDLRHFMAHGTVEVALKQNGEPIYIFRMILILMARQITLSLSRDQKLKAAGRVSRTLQKPWHRSSKPQRTARENSRSRVDAYFCF